MINNNSEISFIKYFNLKLSFQYAILLYLLIGVMSYWAGLQIYLLFITIIFFCFLLINYFENVYQIKQLKILFLISISFKISYLLFRLVFNDFNFENEILSRSDAEGYYDITLHGNFIFQYRIDQAFTDMLKFLVMIFGLQLDVDKNLLLFISPSLIVSSFLPIIIYIFSLDYVPKNVSKIIFWISLFDLSINFYSTILLKDVLAATFVSGLFLPFPKKRKASMIILYSIAIISAFLLRFRSLGLSLYYLLNRIFFYYRGKMRYLLLTIISIISLSTIVASINLFSTLNKGKKISDTEETFRDAIIEKEKGGRLNLIINKQESFFIRFFGRAALSILAPIPPVNFYKSDLAVRHQKAQIAKDLSGVYWHLLFPFLLAGTLFCFKERNFFLISCAFITAIMMGLTATVDYRVRFMSIVPLYTLIGKGIEYKSITTKYAYLYYFLLIAGNIIYEQIM